MTNAHPVVQVVVVLARGKRDRLGVVPVFRGERETCRTRRQLARRARDRNAHARRGLAPQGHGVGGVLPLGDRKFLRTQRQIRGGVLLPGVGHRGPVGDRLGGEVLQSVARFVDEDADGVAGEDVVVGHGDFLPPGHRLTQGEDEVFPGNAGGEGDHLVAVHGHADHRYEEPGQAHVDEPDDRVQQRRYGDPFAEGEDDPGAVRGGRGADEDRRRHVRRVHLVAGVGGHRVVGDVGSVPGHARVPDARAVQGQLVRADSNAVGVRVGLSHPVAEDRRCGRSAAVRRRFGHAVEVQLQLRPSGHAHLLAEGHRHLDQVARDVDVVPPRVAGEGDRSDGRPSRLLVGVRRGCRNRRPLQSP